VVKHILYCWKAIVRFKIIKHKEERKRETLYFPGLKVPRQCSLLLLVKVSWREGTSFRSEEGEDLWSGLCYYISRSFTAFDRNFDVSIGRTVLGWRLDLMFEGLHAVASGFWVPTWVFSLGSMKTTENFR
jgi:hypothetical protein